MITISTVLNGSQDAAYNILVGDDFYNGNASVNTKSIPIITQVHGDVQQSIDLCLGQVGICALLMVPSFEFHQAMAQDLSGWASITIGIYENGTVNQGSQGTGIVAIELVERTLC